MKLAERRSKAEKWVTVYDGTLYGGDIVKAYRKKFAVDRMKAVEELQLLGVSLTKEQIDREKAAVKAYQEIQRAKKAKGKESGNRRGWRRITHCFLNTRMIHFIISPVILPAAHLMG